MANSYVLDRNHLDNFLECILNNANSQDAEIESLIHECTYYTSSIYSNNYFFAKNIQRKITINEYAENYLDQVYRLQDEKSFYLDELDSKFISFLISHTSNPAVDLDIHLKEIQEDYINSNYGKQIRY